MMELIIDSGGEIHCLYSETIELSRLGQLQIRRASHVEPDEQGSWWADLAPVQGPKLGPFARRSEALEAETWWLSSTMSGPQGPQHLPQQQS